MWPIWPTYDPWWTHGWPMVDPWLTNGWSMVDPYDLIQPIIMTHIGLWPWLIDIWPIHIWPMWHIYMTQMTHLWPIWPIYDLWPIYDPLMPYMALINCDTVHFRQGDGGLQICNPLSNFAHLPAIDTNLMSILPHFLVRAFQWYDPRKIRRLLLPKIQQSGH